MYFTPEVHAALWKHAGEDTSVEICGVLVGTWHRDEVGPFVKIVDSIRGEGATTKFAEVTFTHQTWAKINAEMDTKFADAEDRRLVPHPPGFRHLPLGPRPVHPGAFLLRAGPDRARDRPDPQDRGGLRLAGRQADPGRTFLGRRPDPDRPAGRGESRRDRPAIGAGAAAGGGPRPSPGSPRTAPPATCFRPWDGSSCMGASSWWATCWRRCIRRGSASASSRAEVASNGVASLLRLGLSDELDRSSATWRPSAGRSRPPRRRPAGGLGLRRHPRQLIGAARRAANIKERYGNTPADETSTSAGCCSSSLPRPRRPGVIGPVGIAEEPHAARHAAPRPRRRDHDPPAERPRNPEGRIEFSRFEMTTNDPMNRTDRSSKSGILNAESP